MKKSLLLLIPMFILLVFSQHINAQAPALGAAGNFALFTSTGGVTNTGLTTSIITGDVGSNAGAVSGFGNVNGVIHPTPDLVTGAAAADLLIAYNLLMAKPRTGVHAPNLTDATFTPGVYDIAGNTILNGKLTFDAQNDPNAVFVIRIGPGATFSTGSASTVILNNGAQSCNIFWTVGGAINIGDHTIMRGNVIANNGAIDLATDVVVDGRILSTTGAITLLNSTVKMPAGCGKPTLTGPVAPNLGEVRCYAIFSANGGVTNDGITMVKGDVGTNVGLTAGYVDANVNGKIHPAPDASTAQAATDLNNAYNYLNALPYDIQLLRPDLFGNDLELTPHTYWMNAATALTGTVTLNGQGNPDAVFVIQINGAFSTGINAKVVLTNGTQAKNVFWKIDGAVGITSSSVLKGTIIANNNAIDLGTGVDLEGRILSTTGAVTTHSVTVTSNEVCSSTLPVSWLYFRGKTTPQKVILEWATTNEVNNDYFIIEKSDNGENFIELAKVKSVANGNEGDNFYTLTDELPMTSAYYKVSQTDFDGKRKWNENIVVVKSGLNTGFSVKHHAKENTIFVQTSGAIAGKGSIELFSISGKKVASQQVRFSKGHNSYQIQHSLNKGIYIIVIRAQNEKIYSSKIMVK